MKIDNPFLVTAYVSPQLFCDREAETATDGLAPFHGLTHLPQGTDLEYVGVIPAFSQSRVAEYEAHGLLLA